MLIKYRIQSLEKHKLSSFLFQPHFAGPRLVELPRTDSCSLNPIQTVEYSVL